MSQPLLLNCDNHSIGVVRIPFERVVTEYYYSFNYIGFDKWATKFTPTPQVEPVSYTHLTLPTIYSV